MRSEDDGVDDDDDDNDDDDDDDQEDGDDDDAAGEGSSGGSSDDYEDDDDDDGTEYGDSHSSAAELDSDEEVDVEGDDDDGGDLARAYDDEAAGAGDFGPRVDEKLRPLLEPQDYIERLFNCERATGMDTVTGVLLLGGDHLYLIDGFRLAHGALAGAANAEVEEMAGAVMATQAAARAQRATSAVMQRLRDRQVRQVGWGVWRGVVVVAAAADACVMYNPFVGSRVVVVPSLCC